MTGGRATGTVVGGLTAGFCAGTGACANAGPTISETTLENKKRDLTRRAIGCANPFIFKDNPSLQIAYTR